jgi:hypothetical protein
VTRHLLLAVGEIRVPAMVFVFALGAQAQQDFPSRPNEKQPWRDRALGTESPEVEDGFSPNRLLQLPALNDKRPCARPCKRRREGGHKIQSMTVVEPNLIVPFVADMIGKGLLD